jgi:hypothetical protein
MCTSSQIGINEITNLFLYGNISKPQAIASTADTYVFKPGDGKDTVIDSDGKGSIVIGGNSPLSGATAADHKFLQNGQAQWSVNNGATIYTLDEKRKKLVITGTSLGADSQITINDFDIAQSSGYLGIKLDSTPKLALRNTGGEHPFKDSSFNPATLTGNATLQEHGGESFAVYLNRAAEEGDRITLGLTGLYDKFQAILRNSTVARGPSDGIYGSGGTDNEANYDFMVRSTAKPQDIASAGVGVVSCL